MGNSQRWVQHVSSVGKKYRVDSEQAKYWTVYYTDELGYYLNLPKPEYAICDPPEQWVDVTKDCVIENESIKYNGIIVHTSGWYQEGNYRLRKLDSTIGAHPRYSFIVEKRINNN